MHGRVPPQNNPGLGINVLDVAAYILRERGPMDAMKLQKLCYYSQAWSLAWHRGPMFDDRIEAWENGPVVRALFREHRGQYWVDHVPGRADLIEEDPTRQATLSDVLAFYGDRSGQQLSDLTHNEIPWLETRARARCAPGEPCTAEIDRGLIEAYYVELWARAQQRQEEEAEARAATTQAPELQPA